MTMMTTMISRQGGYKLKSYKADTVLVEHKGYEYKKLKHRAAAIVVLEINGLESIVEGSRAVEILISNKTFIMLEGVGYVDASYKKKIEDKQEESIVDNDDGSRDIEFKGKKCRGNITVSATAGYRGDPITYYITVQPPESADVARVTTDNPGCHNCDAEKVREGYYTLNHVFHGGVATFSVRFIVFDADGNEMCNGSTGTLRNLGEKKKTYDTTPINNEPGHDWDPNEYVDDIVPERLRSLTSLFE